ncbi:myelin expression factor 2-like [Uloborus diversus]|uniref:myelin expression factor 2-like n=1 Tax=Uloborus diversus TaxID=327109 RepID=UPI00240A89EB|nr:myelin expression factor 2-like [Uloborus diversus]XP_054723155.1 myelin expression factor 2-like [Uloborus diversus]
MDNGKWQDSMEKDQRDRRSRSRSPLEKNNKSNRSRESSTNRNSRQSKGNRDRSPRGRRTRAPTNRRIYVANIPYDCKWTIIKDLFREKVGDVSYVELFEDESGKFRGCGIVEFKEASSVQKAVDLLHRYEFKSRQLVVKEDFDVDRDKTGKPLGRSRGGGGGGGMNNMDRDRDDFGGLGGMGNLGNNNTPQYTTYGLSPQFLDALGIKGPLTCRVFVANLDYKVTTQKLEEVFKLAGRVVKIDLKRDEDGNSKGHGTIEMGHPVEAVQAISMFNGQKFYNRTMSVRMDKKHKDDGEDKRLPEGLQSVGKGLGANGLPLHLSNSSAVNNMATSGLTPVGGLGGVGAGSLGLMPNQMTSSVVGASATGIPGLAGIGMGIQERNFSNLNAGVGVGGVGQSLGLGSTGAAGLGNPSLLPGGLGTMSNTPGGLGAGGLGGGLGTSLTGGLGGTGLSLGATAVGGAAGLGYSDYDRSFDRADDGYRNSRSSDTIVVRNLPMTYTWQNLRDRFREIGDIRYTEMKGRGTAIVRFTSERDAQRAVDHMRGARIEGRVLDVSLY